MRRRLGGVVVAACAATLAGASAARAGGISTVWREAMQGHAQEGAAPRLPAAEDGDATSPVRPRERPFLAPRTASPSQALPSGGCPVDHGAVDEQAVNPLNMMPPENQRPAPGQLKPLDTTRQRSSIPKGDFTPAHQAGQSESHWVYPSEQMFYNAMRRKGWNPSEADAPQLVAIHNAVNEQGWAEVLRWERLHGSECSEPRLFKFQGRPNDLSPKARLGMMFGNSRPFDRHDWIVDRCGRQVRYVIDFYNGAPSSDPSHPISIYLDVRPALDSPGSVWDRMVAMPLARLRARLHASRQPEKK